MDYDRWGNLEDERLGGLHGINIIDASGGDVRQQLQAALFGTSMKVLFAAFEDNIVGMQDVMVIAASLAVGVRVIADDDPALVEALRGQRSDILGSMKTDIAKIMAAVILDLADVDNSPSGEFSRDNIAKNVKKIIDGNPDLRRTLGSFSEEEIQRRIDETGIDGLSTKDIINDMPNPKIDEIKPDDDDDEGNGDIWSDFAKKYRP